MQYTAFHAKKFTALVSSPTNSSSHPEHVDFELQSRASAQALYRTITEFHTFFKREAVGRVVKTAGFCKSLLGNFKGQNPDRFYFDVTRTHREVVDHVWLILNPSARTIENDDCNTVQSPNNFSTLPGMTSPNVRGSRHSSSIRNNSRHSNHSHHRHDHGSSSSLHSSPSSSHFSPPPPPLPRSSSSSRSLSSTTTEEEGNARSSHSHQHQAPPLPPCHGRGSRSGSMHRSHSVQESDLRPSNFTYLPPLPPYSQRSCSSDILLHSPMNGSRRPHIRTIPTHGPHMASMASFNQYTTPSISEQGSDGEEEDQYYGGGSECYVTMSSCSDSIYVPSTHSDPGSSGTLERRTYRPHHISSGPAIPPSSTPGHSSEMYITSGDSECSGASYRVSSPPPLYQEVDEAHTVPITFNTTENTISTGTGVMPTSPDPADGPNSASIRLVSPVVPLPETESNFNTSAVLTRTRELEGELQRLRTAMTCRLCKQNPIGATFCPCGHTVCCYQCAQRMGTCWECDATITSVQKILLTR